MIASIAFTAQPRPTTFIPALLAQGFSSAGCLTLPGSYVNGQHTGSWADFRSALGIDDQSDGRQFSLVLLTGLDAAMAANVRVSGGNKVGTDAIENRLQERRRVKTSGCARLAIRTLRN